MRPIGSLTRFTCVLLLMAGTCMAQAPGAATKAAPAATADAPAFTPERITGRLVNTGSGGGSTHFTLQVDGLSTDEQMAGLRAMLDEKKGEDKVIGAMEKMPAIGWMRLADSIRYTVPVIDSIPVEGGGRIIRVVTPRSLVFGEVMTATRSRKYRFGIVELILGPDGAGEGQVLAAARFKIDKKGDLQIESYGIAPVKILNVQAKPGGGEDEEK